MIRHLFKLVWNRKKANSLIMSEIFFSFLVLYSETEEDKFHRLTS